MKKSIVVLATVAIVAGASCAFAGARPGFNAYGALTPFDTQRTVQTGVHINAARAAALRDCNGEAAAYSQKTWGVRQGEIYRSCMAALGQVE